MAARRGPSVRIGSRICVPTLCTWVRIAAALAGAVLANHVEMTRRLARDLAAGFVDRPELVVWPENSSDVDPFADAAAAEQISSAARAVAAPIMVGAVLAGPTGVSRSPSTTNSVIVWPPESGPGPRHDKKILQPFGEYIPWRGFFRVFSAYADRAGNFVPGDGSGVVQAAGVSVGVTACWEVVFDRAPRDAVRNGAQVLVVPSNNATFNEAMSRQQLAFAKIRALEHDRPVVVATGIGAVVRSDGTMTRRPDSSREPISSTWSHRSPRLPRPPGGRCRSRLSCSRSPLARSRERR